MSDKDMQSRVQLLSVLFGCYGQAADTNRLAIYAKMLVDFPVSVLEAASRRLMLENKYLPSVAEIVEACKSISATKSGNAAIDYITAWQEVREQLYKTGVYGIPQFSSPMIESAVRAIGGWRNLAMVEERNFPVLQAQFRDAFNIIKKREADNAINCYVLKLDGKAPLLLEVKKDG